MSWPLVKLGDLVVSMHQGINTAADKVVYSTETGTPIIQSKHFTSGRLSLDDTKLLNEADTNKYKGKYTINAGDVLLSNIGTVGKSIVVEPNDSFMFAWNVFRIKVQRTKLFNRYLNYYLKHLDNISYYERLFTGGTVKFINKKNIGEIEIPLPPLAEQKRIAAILDKADAIRQKRQQAIQLADDFLRSVFLDMFGDPVTNPKGWEVISMADYGTFKNGLNFSRDESGVSLHCLGVGNFKSLDRIEDIEGLPKVELNKLPQADYLLKNNDLVFVRSNGNKALVGRCVTVHPQKEKVTFSGFCIRFRVSNPNLDPNFLNLCLRIPSMKNEMLQGGQGANIQNINQKLLASLRIPLPPIEDQKRYSDLVSTFRLLLTKKQNSAINSSELFNSLSQKAFAGEL